MVMVGASIPAPSHSAYTAGWPPSTASTSVSSPAASISPARCSAERRTSAAWSGSPDTEGMAHQSDSSATSASASARTKASISATGAPGARAEVDQTATGGYQRPSSLAGPVPTPSGWPYPAGMLATVRIGMVGAGAVAARHLRTLLAMDGVEVAAVADPALERAKELAAEAGAAVYPNHMELLEAERLDAVYICVPPFAHGAPELAAIDAGLPMFVEKPVAIDQQTAATIAGRLAGRSLITCTGYHWRWLDIFDRAAGLLADRPARLVQCSWLDKVPPPPWWLRRDGSGGQTIEQTTHVLDTARGLAGDVVEVHSYGSRAAANPPTRGSAGPRAAASHPTGGSAGPRTGRVAQD